MTCLGLRFELIELVMRQRSPNTARPPSTCASLDAPQKLHRHLRALVPGSAYSPAGRCGGLSSDDGRREETVEKKFGLSPALEISKAAGEPVVEARTVKCRLHCF